MLSVLIRKYDYLLFYSYGILFIACLCLGFVFEQPLLFLLPALLLGGLVVFYDYKIVYYLLVAVLPMSTEVLFESGFGTDLPSEPILISLVMVFGFLILFKPAQLLSPFYKHPITLLLLLHLGWIVITLIMSTQRELSIKYLITKIWYVSVFFFMSGMILTSEKSFRKLLWTTVLPTILAVVLIIYKHSKWGFLFEYVNKSVVPFFRNHVNYGVFITMLVPLLVAMRFWYKKGSIMRLLMDIFTMITLIGIYLTYTRGAWLALVALPIVYIIVLYKKMKHILLSGFIVVFLFFGYLSVNNNYLRFAPDYAHTIYHDNLKDHIIATFSGKDMSTMERFYRWVAAFKMTGDSPVFGFGPNSFVKTYKSYTVTSFATYISRNEENSTVHNYFILLMAEQGIPGMLIFMGFIAMVLITAERVYHQQNTFNDKWIVMVALMVIIVFLINNLFSDLLEANKLAPLFFIMVAIIINWDFKSKLTLQNDIT